MKLNERNIFLLDGVGALLSAILAGLVLPIFSEQIGMSKWILYSLALLGLAYAIYSLSCFLLIKRTTPLMLLVIIAANAFYCALTSAIVITANELTILGRVYLIVEIGIIGGLIGIETKIYRRIPR